MTRLHLHIGGSTLHLGLTPLVALGAFCCAVVLMTMFVSTLRLAVSRGEQLRESQRAVPAFETRAATIAPRRL